MIRNDFLYEKPDSLSRLFALMKEDGVKLLAGGTDVIPPLREGKRVPRVLADVKGLPELQGIRALEDGGLFIGAAEPVEAVVRHPLTRVYTALVQGAGAIGCLEIRWRATIGGNICNASPSADALPGLLVYDADAALISEHGERVTPLESFLLEPGRTDLREGEVLKGVLLKKPAEGSQSRYYRRSRVKGMDLSALSVAIYCEGRENFRIALGAAWPKVARAREAERILAENLFSRDTLDRAMEAILASVRPREESLRAAPKYKRAMIPVLIERGIAEMNGGLFCE